MIIKHIIALCKRDCCLALYDDNHSEGAPQWLGTHAALYPMQGMPKFDNKSVCTAFDITDKQAQKIFFRNGELPEIIDCRDVIDCENILESDGMEIGFAGKILRPLHTSKGLQFIDTAYLRPLADCDGDMLQLYERTTPNGETYIAAKAGMILLAIIWPFDAVNKEFVKKLREIAKDCEIALAIKQKKQ